MWKPMLQTERLDIQMNTEDQVMQLKVSGQNTGTPISVELSHAELIQMIHAMLEINRNFRGDIPYYDDAASRDSSY